MNVTSITRAAACAALAVFATAAWCASTQGARPDPVESVPADAVPVVDSSGQIVYVLPNDDAAARTRTLYTGEQVMPDMVLEGEALVVEPDDQESGGLRANQCFPLGTGVNTFGASRTWHGDVIGVGPSSAGKKLTQVRVLLSSTVTQSVNLTFTVYKLDRNQNKYVPLAIKVVSGQLINSTPKMYASGDFNNGNGVILQIDHDGNQSFEGRYALGVGWNVNSVVSYRRDTGAIPFELASVTGYWVISAGPPAVGSTTPVTLTVFPSNSLFIEACIEAPPGACCLPNDTCEPKKDRVACENIGGQFTASEVSCGDVSCPLPQGACCMGDACEFTNEYECIDPLGLNGVWQIGRDCYPYNPCGDPRGACCRVTGHCEDELTSAECGDEESGNHWYEGDACNQPSVYQSCGAQGACCGTGGCHVKPEASCNAPGDTYMGDGTTCTSNICSFTLGACCNFDGSCGQSTRYECEHDTASHTPGVWYAGTTCQAAQCPIQGACCTGPAVCTNGIETDCLACRDPIAPLTCPSGYTFHPRETGPCPDVNTNGSCTLTARTWYLGQPCEYGPCRDAGHVGRCCVLGECKILNSVDCETAGGTFTDMGSNGFAACTEGGVLADCSASAQVGACCMGTSCELKSEADCINSNGSFSTNGVGCASISCVTRACCDLASNGCSTVSATECESQGGDLKEPGTSCSLGGLNPCEVYGACCFEDGTCGVRNESVCISSNGVFQGAESSCQTVVCPVQAACCFGAFGSTCDMMAQADCMQLANADFLGDGSECGPGACDVGGCCALDQTCSNNVHRAECDAAQGQFLGTGIDCLPSGDCPPRGACCHADQCTVDTQTACEGSQGVYRGDGLPCLADTCAKVPCCIDTAPCKVIYNDECASTGGFAGAVGANCTADFCTPGACCVGSPTAVCKELIGVQCASSNGTFEGAATTCGLDSCTVSVGACCLAAGQAACIDGVSEADCISTNGLFKGLGTHCGPDLCVEQGVCCHGGACDDNNGALFVMQQCEPCGTFSTENTCAAASCPAKPICNVADVNCDGNVNGGDILSIRAPGAWSSTAAPGSRLDVNADGFVNGGDILAVKAPGTWNSSTGDCDSPP